MELEIVKHVTGCVTSVALLVASVFWLKFILEFLKETKPKPTVLEQIFGSKGD